MTLKTVPTNKYLVEIIKPIARMPIGRYIQEASLSHDNTRVYINTGSAGGLSISIKSVVILACGVAYMKECG